MCFCQGVAEALGSDPVPGIPPTNSSPVAGVSGSPEGSRKVHLDP